jgi:hypothetical protein
MSRYGLDIDVKPTTVIPTEVPVRTPVSFHGPQSEPQKQETEDNNNNNNNNNNKSNFSNGSPPAAASSRGEWVASSRAAGFAMDSVTRPLDELVGPIEPMLSPHVFRPPSTDPRFPNHRNHSHFASLNSTSAGALSPISLPPLAVRPRSSILPPIQNPPPSLSLSSSAAAAPPASPATPFPSRSLAHKQASPLSLAEAAPLPSPPAPPQQTQSPPAPPPIPSVWLGLVPPLARVEMLVTFLQLVVVMSTVDAGWPHFWTEWMRLLNYTTWDPRIRPIGMEQLDFRAHFTIITTVSLLAVSFVMLVFLASPAVAGWAAALAGSFCMLLAGVIVLGYPNHPFRREAQLHAIIGAGALGLLFCLVAALVYRVVQARFAARLRKENPGREGDVDYLIFKERLAQGRRAPTAATALSQLVVIAGLIITGLLCLEAIRVSPEQAASVPGPLNALGKGLGRVCLFAAGILAVRLALRFAGPGRAALARISAPLRRHFISALLFILVVGYVPVCNTLWQSMICRTQTCPKGTMLPTKDLFPNQDRLQPFSPRAPAFVSNSSSNATSSAAAPVCLTCPFEASCAKRVVLCQGEVSTRLVADYTLECSKDIYPYYTPVGVLLTLMFAVLVPVAYTIIIGNSTKFLSSSLDAVAPASKLPPRARAEGAKSAPSAGELWSLRVGASVASAKSVFAPFERSQRFHYVVICLYKAMVVGCAVGISEDSPAASMSVQLALHLCFCLWNLYARPYINDVDDYLATGTSLALAVLACAGLGYERSGVDRAGPMVAAIVISLAVVVASLALGSRARLATFKTAMALCALQGRAARGDSEAVNLAIHEIATIPQLRWQYTAFRQNARQMILKDNLLEERERRAVKGKDFGERAEAVGVKDIRVSEALSTAQDAGAAQRAQDRLVERISRENEKRDPGNPPKTPWNLVASAAQQQQQQQQRGDSKERPDIHHRAAELIQRVARGFLARKGVRMAESLQVMDARLERVAVRTLSTLMVALLIAAAMSLVLIMVGVISSSVESTVIPHEPVKVENTAEYIYLHDLATERSWADFTYNCCCKPVGAIGDRYPVAELWTCATGYKKIKARAEIVGGKNITGLDIRPLCGLNFTRGICSEPFFEIDTTLPKGKMTFMSQDVCSSALFQGTAEVHALKRLW